MNNVESVLVIILACVLILFLALGIAAIIVTIKLLASAKRAVERAEDVIEIAGEASENFKRAAGPLTLLKLVRGIIKMTARKRRS
ncbi:MAG: hypothetical protein ACREF5_03230 [Candidatus Saccharimonadales bacterium]